ncbi:family 10 glycosylhydrolase [Hymenobacter monticola]|uniref:Family 10 glycosylhydrolase n=1 Tax=Hymenobacter monticola TaxID=1705399 RepID=A0ABY4B5K6_9BACT|nr:family 10 glycosylhydrolase [Hymenobacter monticola]UOE34445.1 family 10 glycosylhydrolase [Hymenobacter monticola]
MVFSTQCWRGLSLALALLALAFSGQSQTLSAPPKREMRAAWIAHVFNLDWPSARTRTPVQQRQEFVSLLDRHRQNGINAVVVQVRAAADAVYPSTLEPWSEWLNGTQGQAPSPAYDPLAFMVRETHRREMEFHAWINPYRALTSATASVAPTHVTVQHPDWVVPYGTLRVLDPGLPAVRQYLVRVVMDVVRRYDVDAIHFDDYFYPAPQTGVTFNDAATFAAYPRGFTVLADWRRSNVDLFVKMVSDSIRAAKPWVKFGISPPGVWRNGTSVGGTATTAFQSYTDVYADSRKWLKRGWVDYLAPQVYFAIGQTAANYSLIVPWWSQQVNPDTVRHVYVGQGAYRVSATATEPGFRLPTQLPNQIRLLRQQPNVQGSIFYSSNTLLANPMGFVDSLRTSFYRFPALVPTMPWKDAVPPLTPRQVSQYNDVAQAETRLSWQAPLPATDGETARWYAVYRFPGRTTPITAADLANPANLLGITDTTAYRIGGPPDPARYVYAVTALDRLHNESAPANVSVFLLTATAQANALALFEPAAPNPFTAETRLAFTLPTAGPVSLRVIDLAGREVAVLAEGLQAAGRHEAALHAADWPAGLYVVVLQTAGGVARQKVLLLR